MQNYTKYLFWQRNASNYKCFSGHFSQKTQKKTIFIWFFHIFNIPLQKISKNATTEKQQ